jgi:hypothetical protein
MSTEDYFLRIQSLSQDKLLDEERRIYDLIFKISETSPMYNQLWDMLGTVHASLREKQFMERQGKQPDSEIIEIGKIEEVVYTPEYNSQELLLAIVNQYTNRPGGKQ